MLARRNLSNFFTRFISFTNFSIMEDSKAIMSRFQEINNTVSSLKEMLAKCEHEYYEQSLVARLEEQNSLFQAEVQKAVKMMSALQDSFSGKCMDDVENAKTEVATGATISDQENQDKKPKGNKKNKTVEKTDGKPKDGKKPNAVPDESPVDVGRLDMRVGKIVEIQKHPDADSLYVEKVDIGQPNPITVVSGLVKHVPIEEMQNRLVVILCNLKPAKMRGITSEGMVMCASTPDKVEVLRPPATSVPGDLIAVPGYPRVPDPVMNPKKKIFETVAPDLKTDDDLCAVYKGAKWVVEGKGHVTSDSLKGVNVK